MKGSTDMASTKTKAPAGETPAATTTSHPAKGQPRPRAAVETIDFADAAAPDDLKVEAAPRNSKWMQTLNDLYEGTAAGKVPRDEDGSLKFIRLGTFNNPGGARTQVKAFEDKALDGTYEFKTVVKGHQSFLWARVREVETASA